MSSLARTHHLKSSLNPFKFSKDETSGLFEHFGDGDRYSMYTADGYNLQHLQRQLTRTFERRPPPPPSAQPDAPPASAQERSRMNLLRWLASPMCQLFSECEDSVSVNDVELDELVTEAKSEDDAGVNVIKVLVRWSAEGRKYSQWKDVVSDMKDLQHSRPLLNSFKREAIQRMGAEQRREAAFARRLEKERQERFARLCAQQEEERQARAQRKKDREEAKQRLLARKQQPADVAPSVARPSSRHSSRGQQSSTPRTGRSEESGEKEEGTGAEEEKKEEAESTSATPRRVQAVAGRSSPSRPSSSRSKASISSSPVASGASSTRERGDSSSAVD